MSAECSTENIPPGYKQTEVGVIPGDWEVKRLEEIADVIDPHPSHRAPPEVTNGIPFVGIGDLNDNGDIIGNKIRTVDPSVFEEHQKRYDLGEELIGLGRVASIGKVVKIKFSGNIYTISPTLGVIRGTKVKRDYLLYALKAKATADQFNKIMSGSTRSSVGMIVLRKLEIILPSKEDEQEAIAEALSDADAFIESLEQLIFKKRQIKQGAMQELLTGKRRLPGFSGEWDTVAVSDCFELVSNRNAELNDNVVTISAQLGFVRQEEFFKKRVASKLLENYYLIERGHFAYNRSYSNGYPFGAIKRLTKYDKGVVTTLYICFAPKPDAEADSLFFEHYFEAGLLNPGLATVTNEGGRAHGLLNITKADFFSRELKHPSLDEQKAIATILSDMDSEITALEEKLAKARQLKQGMMQELLTGRIRLV